jgi:DNA-binding transcriptional MerR regulator
MSEAPLLCGAFFFGIPLSGAQISPGESPDPELHWAKPWQGEEAAVAQTDGHRKGGPTDAPFAIPDKLYFRIGEVAQLLDLPTYVLRFWETEFPQLKPGKGGTGQRLYRRRDVETALEIRRLLYEEGYTIPGARQLLKTGVRRKEPSSHRDGIAAGPDLVPAEAQTTVEQAAQGASDSTDTSPAEKTRLHRLKHDLRELSSLLSRPIAAQPRRPNPAHRGLHLSMRRRPSIADQPPPLFATRPVDDNME